jgi:hypothetical protein
MLVRDALEKLYGVCGCGTLTMLPDMDPIKMIEPPSGIRLDASRAQYHDPMTLMSSNFLIFSVGYSCAT